MEFPKHQWHVEATAQDPSLPLRERVIRRRGLLGERNQKLFASGQPSLSLLHDPGSLHGAIEVAQTLDRWITESRRIAVYGDYDADGICACAILIRLLRLLNVEPPAIAYIPHRVVEGYGLHAEALQELHAQGIDAVITVDCGGSSIEEAKLAKSLGMELAITDHHRLLRDVDGKVILPECVALAHPELGDTPFRPICAAMVALKIAKRLIRIRTGEKPPLVMTQWIVNEALPLAAVGTVADVMPLLDENRIVVGNGLAALRTTTLVGLRSVIPGSAFKSPQMDSSVIGFQIAPRLNSAGRLEHATQALDLLLSDQPDACKKMAAKLDELNFQRKQDTEVVHLLARSKVLEGGLNAADSCSIVLADRSWNPGILGPAASRLSEEFARPVLLFGASESGWKGSGRAPSGFDLHACLTSCAKYFTSFGGHAAAAGGSMSFDQLEPFVKDFEVAARTQMREGVRKPDLFIDAELPYKTAKDKPALAEIQSLGPFGQGFPEPNILIRGLRVLRTDILAGTGLKLLVEDDANAKGELILWRCGHLRGLFTPGRRFDAVGCPKPSSNPRFPPSIHVKDVRFHDGG
ncbi:MAG: DHH family phosphoesterase [Planctomycetes bacterium]|nr:DHH family phosphoesterase [Planctomycetota bacterium]